MRLLVLILCVFCLGGAAVADIAVSKWKLTVTILDRDGSRLDKLVRQDMESGGAMRYDTKAECEAFMATPAFAEERVAIAQMADERFPEGSTETFACEPIPAPAENI